MSKRALYSRAKRHAAFMVTGVVLSDPKGAAVTWRCTCCASGTATAADSRQAEAFAYRDYLQHTREEQR